MVSLPQITIYASQKDGVCRFPAPISPVVCCMKIQKHQKRPSVTADAAVIASALDLLERGRGRRRDHRLGLQTSEACSKLEPHSLIEETIRHSDGNSVDPSKGR
mmetsp:Transcript_4336/g.7578  ORF Transcript_4336/g.7578 Transcript_4336/m.7578 type:complete len:104 (+) Transcript_4336:316-627(+)